MSADSGVSPEQETVGDRISLGELEIGPEIGLGGFGRVFKARHPGNVDWEYAIKSFEPSPFQDPHSSSKRFEREIALLKSLRHRHIIKIYFSGTHNDRPFFVMEHFEGENLSKVHACRPDPNDVAKWISMYADALSHAHGLSMVHRDIKPQNLMIRRNGRSEVDVRVLDFGVAAKLDSERLTRVGQTYTGDAFSAPEMDERGGDVDLRADIYSLGAVWFYLLHGRSPKGLTIDYDPGVPQEYWEVLRKCIRGDRDQRHQSMTELKDKIDNLLGGKITAVTQVEQSSFFWHPVIYLLEVMHHSTSTTIGARRVDVRRALRRTMGKYDLVLADIYLLDNGYMEETEYSDDDYLIRATAEGRGWAFQHRSIVSLLSSVPVEESANVDPGPYQGSDGSDDDLPF